MFKVTVESDLRQHWHKAMDVVAEGCRDGLSQGLEAGVVYARTNHRYVDRTGNLTKSIGQTITRFDGYGAEGDLFALAKYASIIEDGSVRHPISPKKRAKDPRNRRQWLAWQGEGGAGDWHFAKTVDHPGTKPYEFMAEATHKTGRVAMVVIQDAVVVAQKELDK